MKNCINVAQKKDLFILKISDDAEFDSIKRELKRKMMQLKKLYKDEKTPILVVGKVLRNKEIEEI